MGQPKITPKQTEESAIRIAAGEISLRKAAEEIGVSPIALKKRIDAMGGKKEIKDAIITAKVGVISVARAKATATKEVTEAIEKAPERAQKELNRWIADLNTMADSAMRGAKNGMAVFERVSKIAAMQAELIDPDAPMESQEQLQAIAGLTKIGNEARQAGMEILKMSHEEMQERRRTEEKPQNRITRIVIRPGIAPPIDPT